LRWFVQPFLMLKKIKSRRDDLMVEKMKVCLFYSRPCVSHKAGPPGLGQISDIVIATIRSSPLGLLLTRLFWTLNRSNFEMVCTAIFDVEKIKSRRDDLMVEKMKVSIR
jgi:hypothetical protein